MFRSSITNLIEGQIVVFVFGVFKDFLEILLIDDFVQVFDQVVVPHAIINSNVGYLVFLEQTKQSHRIAFRKHPRVGSFAFADVIARSPGK